MRFATEVEDPRVRAVAAACSPLDLDRSVAAIDQPSGWIYRRYVLAGLVRMYRQVASKRALALSPEEAKRIRTIRDWDNRVVVPRFGFANAEDYYRRAGVGSRLDRLRLKARLVACRDDPMVPPSAIDGCLNGPSKLRVDWVQRGGHLAFPPDLDLSEDAPLGLSAQMVAWLARQTP